ncbi:MAG: hypothetical protein WDA28_13015, partial [Castellaniella sp.]
MSVTFTIGGEIKFAPGQVIEVDNIAPTSPTSDLDLRGGADGGNVSVIKGDTKITLVPAGAAATVLTVQTTQTANSLAIVPDFGAAAHFVMTAGDQIISGQKTIAG